LLIVSAESKVFEGNQEKCPSFRADFSWMFVGNAIYAGCQFAVLMLLAKLLRPEFVGEYTLGLAIVYPVIALMSFQLRAVLASDIYRQTPFGHYLSLRLLTTGLALLIILATTRILDYRLELSAVVVMVGIAQAIETVSDIYYARLQLCNNMLGISKSLIARAVLSVIALAAGTYLGKNLLWAIAGIIIARAGVLFGYDMRERTHGLNRQSNEFQHEGLRPLFNLKAQRELLSFNFPLGILTLLVTLNSSMPSYFIKHALGERALGIFSAIGFVVSVGSLAAVSLGQSAFTRLARAYAMENIGEFWSLMGLLLVLGAAVGICGIIVSKIAGREILTILFRPEYAEQADLLPWIMAAGGMGYMAQFVGIGMTAARNYKPQIALLSLVSASLSVASYLLVARRGLLGAIFAISIGAFVQVVGGAIILFTDLRRHRSVCGKSIGAAETPLSHTPEAQFNRSQQGHSAGLCPIPLTITGFRKK
jgi:O-antigen/teichoic acid export membrane protein